MAVRASQIKQARRGPLLTSGFQKAVYSTVSLDVASISMADYHDPTGDGRAKLCLQSCIFSSRQPTPAGQFACRKDSGFDANISQLVRNATG